MKRNMKQWIQEMIAANDKTPMPVLSFPAVQLMGVSVRELISDAGLQAEGMRRVAERVPSAAAVSLMDLSVEAECFGAQVRVSDDAIREIIAGYTRESGVRNLERQLAALCRKCAMRFVSAEPPKRITVTGGNLEAFLGVRKYLPEANTVGDQIGLVTGLAWTAVGGATLEVEVNVVDGTGKLELTGNLGDVMKESAFAAMSYIRSRAKELGLAPDFYKTNDIHVHFPEGAVPKDGPSAGITICTAIVSALTNRPVRRDVAMTGEISIRGRVLPIGGLKEKTMAALRHGVKTVIIPHENEKDLQEIDQTVRRALNFLLVDHADAVLDAALVRPVQEEPAVRKTTERVLPVAQHDTAQPNQGIRQ